MRIVIDTNLWISFIISKKFSQVDTTLYKKNARLLFSVELIEEIEATISKPRLKKYFSDNALDEMFNVFDPFIDFVNVKSKVIVCRDPKDDFLLALAKDGKADFLLTGDKDLLSLKKFHHTKIIPFSEFVDL
ncbi:MAG: putative toxin-antitoxin system toxin component, PIN family [Bacteroidetes bacterium]|nr:putative toxin-antitoxin system toxin component, PIN family [Bacteroidota bacterium]